MGPVQSVLIRSTSAGFEPRVELAEQLLLKLSHKVKRIVWERTAEDFAFRATDIENVFEAKAGYGRGWKNLFAHTKFLLFTLIRLRAIEPKLIYACDMDTLLASIIWSFNKDVVVVFDQFDPITSRIRNRPLSFCFSKLEMFLARKSDVRITANKSRIPKEFRHEWFELKNVFNLGLSLKKLEEKPPPFILLYGGILASDRGLISCTSAVSRDSDWEFHIYGQGSISALLRNGTYQNVFVHEPVTHKELMRIANQADLIFAMYDPSHLHNKFTASNKLFEAAQLGVPLITSEKTQLGEVVERYNLGWSIEYDNEKEISDLLTWYKTLNKEEKNEMQKNLYDFFSREYLDQQKAIDRLSQVLRKKMEV